MATIKNFEDLLVWQKAREFDKILFKITLKPEISRDFGLIDQWRRSSGSITDNIAEGFERDGRKEFIQFLIYAKGSAGEARSQAHRAYDRGYLSEDEYTRLQKDTKEISQMLKGFIEYLKKTEYEGLKNKK